MTQRYSIAHHMCDQFDYLIIIEDCFKRLDDKQQKNLIKILVDKLK